MPWLRSLTGGLFSDVFQVVALKASGIKSVADFKGKRIAVGPVGSGGEVDARETLAAYGLTYKDMKVSFVEYTQGIEMLEDGPGRRRHPRPRPGRRGHDTSSCWTTRST
ncbi:MAG: ABC transporter substrate-binding protein [Candidatus Moduliflexus flocculans]|nr:ABC transporter substrate-binding protein [Candidatus Moduliflexus flocculans]